MGRREAAEPGRRELPRVHMKHKGKFFEKKKKIKKKKSKGCGEGDKKEDRAGDEGVERTWAEGGRNAGGGEAGAGGAVWRGPYHLSPSRQPNLK